tara:strand:- start:217 stop:582 length:366 start_codon:yes stop_codon:yes gene_type:complete
MINNIRKLSVFNYQAYHHMPPHNRVRDTDQALYLRHQTITNATIMKMMFREFPEDTEMLLDMGVSLSVETSTDCKGPHDKNSGGLRNRWEIIAHVTSDQRRKWEEYKFMKKLSGKETEVSF